MATGFTGYKKSLKVAGYDTRLPGSFNQATFLQNRYQNESWFHATSNIIQPFSRRNRNWPAISRLCQIRNLPLPDENYYLTGRIFSARAELPMIGTDN